MLISSFFTAFLAYIANDKEKTKFISFKFSKIKKDKKGMLGIYVFNTIYSIATLETCCAVKQIELNW